MPGYAAQGLELSFHAARQEQKIAGMDSQIATNPARIQAHGALAERRNARVFHVVVRPQATPCHGAPNIFPAVPERSVRISHRSERNRHDTAARDHRRDVKLGGICINIDALTHDSDSGPWVV